MMVTSLFKELKTVVLIFMIIAAVWFYKDYNYQKHENIRQTENARQLRMSDSMRFASQILTSKEIAEYLQYQNGDLKSKLEKDNIKLSRIESIISNQYRYQDTTKQKTDLSGLVSAVKNSIPKKQEWIDTSKCMTIKGDVSFDGSKLSVSVNNREFKNKTDAVAYWDRREWSFLGFKTRFLGKRQITAKVYDDCGNSQIINISKVNN